MKNSTMQQTETLMRTALIIIIGSTVLSAVGSGPITKLITDSPWFEISTRNLVIAIFACVGQAGVAIWLYVLAKQYGAYRRLWALFGIFFGISAIVIFYLVRIHNMIETQSKTDEQT